MIRQYPLTPAAGKRLIGKGLVAHPWVTEALRLGRLVVVAGTTNGYVAEEILATIGQGVGFTKQHFFRGITMPPALIAEMDGRPADDGRFPGDVVIDRGVWQRAKTIFDVVDTLGPNDLILKGANALDVEAGHAASFVDRESGGPTGAILPAVLGRQARLLVPVGLEKRVPGSLLELSNRLAGPDGKGLRLCPLPGSVFTEIDAIFLLTGTRATLIGAGGVAGAEGGVWLAIEGSADDLARVEGLMRVILAEPGFQLAPVA
jgi:hypothetical protein